MITGSDAAPNTSALLALFELVAALAAAAAPSATSAASNPSRFSPMLSYLLLGRPAVFHDSGRFSRPEVESATRGRGSETLRFARRDGASSRAWNGRAPRPGG